MASFTQAPAHFATYIIILYICSVIGTILHAATYILFSYVLYII